MSNQVNTTPHYEAFKKEREQAKPIGPWQRLDSKEVYENPWISVHHENVTTPAGTSGIYGLVHFKGTAVGVIPLDDEGNTWLVKQTRYTLEQETYEIPEGGAPAGESTEACALRELQEEVGLTASHLRHLMTLHLSNSVSDESAELYVATGLSESRLPMDDSEDITVHKVPFDEAVAMVKRGDITDAISVAAILHLALERLGS